MCGIFTLLNYSQTKLTSAIIEEQAKKGDSRGPDSSKLTSTNKIFLAFYRLTINGLDKKSDQPLHYNNKVLICNGVIYNYKQLYKLMNCKATTHSDCEVIIHLYEKYGLDYALQCLDGVYAFVLIDYNIDKIYLDAYPQL